MKHRIPGILIFCTVSAAFLGAVYIAIGALLRGAAPSSLVSARPVTAYLITSGVLAVASGALAITAGLLYPSRRTFAGWMLIAAGLFCLPGIITILTALPLLRASADVFKINPPFITFAPLMRRPADKPPQPDENKTDVSESGTSKYV